MPENDLKKLIIQILESCYLMSLGTFDDSGPWVSDVVFVHDNNLNIYWISKIETRHSTSIRLNGKAACSITSSNNQGDENIGLQIEGKAEELDTNLIEIAQAHLKKRNKSSNKPEEILGNGQKWYRLSPTMIEVIYEPLWGFKKQKLSLI